jgi:hypothetical protein
MKKVIAIFITLLSSFAVKAQTTSTAASQQVNLALTDAIAISFVNTGTASGAAITMNFKTVKNYSAGVTSAAQQLKVQSNKNFTISVQANSASFSYSGGTSPAPVMPVGILNVEVTANGTGGTIASPFTRFSSLSASSQNLITNGSYGGNRTFSIKYKATPGFSYPAGTYTTTVVYTATQP